MDAINVQIKLQRILFQYILKVNELQSDIFFFIIQVNSWMDN